MLMVLMGYWLLAPGREWWLHPEWHKRSAMWDLLGEDGAMVAKDIPYRCLYKLLPTRVLLYYLPQGAPEYKVHQLYMTLGPKE